MASGENKIKADFRLEKGLVWVLFFTTYSRHMVEFQAIGISQPYSALGGGGGGGIATIATSRTSLIFR